MLRCKAGCNRRCLSWAALTYRDLQQYQHRRRPLNYWQFYCLHRELCRNNFGYRASCQCLSRPHPGARADPISEDAEATIPRHQLMPLFLPSGEGLLHLTNVFLSAPESSTRLVASYRSLLTLGAFTPFPPAAEQSLAHFLSESDIAHLRALMPKYPEPASFADASSPPTLPRPLAITSNSPIPTRAPPT